MPAIYFPRLTNLILPHVGNLSGFSSWLCPSLTRLTGKTENLTRLPSTTFEPVKDLILRLGTDYEESPIERSPDFQCHSGPRCVKKVTLSRILWPSNTTKKIGDILKNRSLPSTYHSSWNYSTTSTMKSVLKQSYSIQGPWSTVVRLSQLFVPSTSSVSTWTLFANFRNKGMNI